MKKFLMIILTFIILSTAFGISAFAEHPSRVVDEADLLTANEETALASRLDALSDKYQMDVVVLTVESVGDKTVVAYADDYYDYNGYGYNETYDGLLLLVSMEERDWYITTCGEAIKAFSDSDIQAIGSAISEAIGSENYYTAFSAFADECEYYIDGHINGFPFDYGKHILISIAIGLLVAWIATSSMKSKLKTVRFEEKAENYVKDGSMNVTLSRDFFIYRTITRVAKPKNDTSTHTS